MPLVCFIFHVLPVIFLFALNVQGQISFSLGNVTYWSVGSHVKLPWKYNFSSTDILLIRWQFTRTEGSTTVNLATRGSGDAKPKIFYPLFNVTDQATLEFNNAKLTNNGSYSLKVSLTSSGTERISNVLVIVLKQPTAEVTCLKKDLVLNEGERVHCLCTGSNGNPPPTASWSKNGIAINGTGYLSKMLYLNNVTQEKTGVYNCTVRSHNLTDTRLITIKLKEKTKLENITFKINKPSNDVSVGDSVVMTCEADAYPDPEYVIFFNGTRLNRTHAGEYTINSSSLNDTGTYECFAKNILGNISKAILLIVKAKEKMTVTPNEPSTPTEPSSTSSTKNGENSELTKCSNTTEWYLILKGLLCGILSGIILVFSMQWVQRRLRRQKNNSTSSERDDMPQSNYHEGVDNVSAYAELNQQTRKVDDDYQSLKKKSRHTRNNEIPPAQESNYQELNVVREPKESDYQSLNRV